MSKWLRMGLTDKLFLPFVGILLTSVILTIYLSLSFQSRADRTRTAEYQERLKTQWRAQSEVLWSAGLVDRLNVIFRRAVETDPLLLFIQLTDERGSVIASTSADGVDELGGLRLIQPVKGPSGEGKLTIGYAASLQRRTSFALISAILIAGLSTILVGAFIYMKVLKSVLLNRINAAVRIATAIADRDLTQRLEVKGEDELAVLAGAFNRMADNLKTLTKTIYEAVRDIDRTAGFILEAVEMQAGRSERQSAQVSQITAAMSEVAAAGSEIATSSNNVVAIADETRGNADQGVGATDENRQRMDEIAASSRQRVQQVRELHRRAIQVGAVMEFIEQIADQTKLIAFNASIEAAGAGEMGRRFEVVAREIRRLAENVAESAGQIRSRITDIQGSAANLVATIETETEMIKAGSEAAQKTVTILHSIRQGANRTNQLIEDISVSINRQNAATDNLLQSLKSIDNEAASLKEGLAELGHTAGSLVNLSSELHQVSGSFRINEVATMTVRDEG